MTAHAPQRSEPRPTSRQVAPLVLRESRSEAGALASVEMRTDPAYPWAQAFSWERRVIVLTATYWLDGGALVGGTPFADAAHPLVRWFIDGNELGLVEDVLTVMPADGLGPVRLAYRIDPATNALTLSNFPADGSFAIAVLASVASGCVADTHVTTSYSVDAIREGWGPDHAQFLELWHELAAAIERASRLTAGSGPGGRQP